MMTAKRVGLTRAHGRLCVAGLALTIMWASGLSGAGGHAAEAGEKVRAPSLQASDGAERSRAIDAIGDLHAKLHKATADLARIAVYDEDGVLRAKARVMGREVGWDANAWGVVDVCVQALQSGSMTQQHRAMDLLEELGPDAKGAVPLLLRMLRGGADTCISIVSVLGSIGDRTAIPQLLRFYDSYAGLPPARAEGGLALARLGAREIIPLLARDLTASSVQLRVYSAKGLELLGPLPQRVTAELIRLRKDENPFVRRAIIGALAKSGHARTDAVIATISSALGDTAPGVRVEAVRAAVGIRNVPPGVIEKVFSRVHDKAPQVAIAAERGLVTLGEAAVPVLAKLLEKGTKRDRPRAAVLLARIPARGYAALASAAGSESLITANAVFGGMMSADRTEEARDAFEAPLLSRLSNRSLHITAMNVVEALRFSSDKVVGEVGRIMLDKAEPVGTRVYAAEVLGVVGAGSAVAGVALEKASKDTRPELARAAKKAIKALKGESKSPATDEDSIRP